ncbi:hydantoinase B/oxoprolinase family protein, partial [Salmonella enterica]|nr:hydantoinase B/oxoprolinase family protein [Salmonella enterica]
IGAADNHEFDFSAMFDRVTQAPRGRNGGQNGTAGSVKLNDGTAMRSKGWQHVPAGKRLVLNLPGGGGYGDPAQRCAKAHEQDKIQG